MATEAPEAGPDWTTRFEGLGRLPPDIRARLAEGSRIVELPAGATVFAPGQSADNLLLLLEGSIRVAQASGTGREVFLYRVHAGESCVLTTACMLAFEDYSAEGTAETAIRAVAIPRAAFDDLVARSLEFRRFVFLAYSRRIVDLFHLVDDLVARRVDARLAELLLARAEQGAVRATHQALATELGTAREVVSRLLAEWQRRGWIAQARGEVDLSNPEALGRLAAEG